MAYTPYYTGGWQSGEEGGTPITPDALNHMEEGIEDANTLDATPTQGSTKAVQSGGVYTAIQQSTATQDGTYNVAYIAGVAVTQSKLYCFIPFHNPSNKTNITINKFGVVGVWTDTMGVQYVAFDSKNKLGFSLIATAPSNVFAANGAYAVTVQFTVA